MRCFKIRAGLLALITGCSGMWEPGSYAKAVAAPDDQLVWEDAVSEGLYMWEFLIKARGCTRFLKPSTINGAPVYLVKKEDWEYGDSLIGMEFSDSIFIMENISGDYASILHHELGHAYGLEHSTDHNSVMYFNLGKGEITPEDVNQVIINMGCN